MGAGALKDPSKAIVVLDIIVQSVSLRRCQQPSRRIDKSGEFGPGNLGLAKDVSDGFDAVTLTGLPSGWWL